MLSKYYTRIIENVSNSYLLGLYQKEEKQITQLELYKKVDWVKGYHRKLMWAAYKSGLWDRDQHIKIIKKGL